MTATNCFGILGNMKSYWCCTSKVDKNNNQKDDTYYFQKENEMKHEIGTYATLFSFNELKRATNNFKTKLGTRDSSSCYKGTLDNGTAVAVKVLKFRNPDFKLFVEFVVLIKMISQIKHPNVVEFIGCCVEDDHKIIVYEFMEGGSLDVLLDDKVSELSWPMRASVCLGIARGLESLHSHHVLHRDIRPSNVLFDNRFNPKIVYYGTGPVFADYTSDDNGDIPKNIGYLDPEYMSCGNLTSKGDVYAFGVLLLEVISGRRVAKFSGVAKNYITREAALSLTEGKNLVQWAQQYGENGSYMEIIDPVLSEFPEDEVERFIDVALSCVHSSSNLRSGLPEVILKLSTL